MKLSRGRQINHSDKVDLKSIKSTEPDAEHRQVLKFKYLGRKSKKIATIVLMNPSSADKLMADNTIRRVEDITYHLFKDVEEVHVYNLFSIRGKNPSDVNQLFKKYGEESLLYKGTDSLLKRSVKKSEYAIAAWGGPCGINRDLHSLRVAKTLKILSECKKLFRVAGGHYKKDALYPLHGRLWGYNMKPYKYSQDL